MARVESKLKRTFAGCTSRVTTENYTSLWGVAWERGSLVFVCRTMKNDVKLSILFFVILLHLLVARAIHARVESPPRLVLAATGRRY